MMYITLGLFFAGCLVLFVSLMILSRTLTMCIEVMNAMKQLLSLFDPAQLQGRNRS